MQEEQPTAEQREAELATAPAEPDAGYDPYDDQQGWLEEEEQLPPRPRRRLLTPLPLSLLAVLLIACGFIGGVLVEKNQNSEGGAASGSSAAASFASRLRGLAGTSTGTTAASGAGAAGAGSGFTRPTSGTVAYVSGNTLYVTGTESNTVKVDTSAATSVTKTSKSSVAAIHPGESVTITGSAAPNGTVSAESIRVGSAGGGLAALFGGGGAGTTRGKGTSSSGGEPALFGNG